jgi:hypothetical protein
VKAIQDEERLEELKDFYEETFNKVNNLEYLYKKVGSKIHPEGFRNGGSRSSNYLEIFLKPVGQARQPSTPQELKCMLLCILYCIKQLHLLQYLHTDIRWPNVVCHEGAWYLIDCYDVCKITDINRRRAVKSLRRIGHLSTSPEWLPEDDLCQIVMLVDDNLYQSEQFEMFSHLRMIASQVASGSLSVDNLIDVVKQVEV